MTQGFDAGYRVLSIALFAQLVIALINPPEDPWGFLTVVVVIDAIVFAFVAKASAERAKGSRNKAP